MKLFDCWICGRDAEAQVKEVKQEQAPEPSHKSDPDYMDPISSDPDQVVADLEQDSESPPQVDMNDPDDDDMVLDEDQQPPHLKEYIA